MTIVKRAVYIDSEGYLYLPLFNANGTYGDMVLGLNPCVFVERDNLLQVVQHNALMSGLTVDNSRFPYEAGKFKHPVINDLDDSFIIIPVSGEMKKGYHTVVKLNKENLAGLRASDAPMFKHNEQVLTSVYHALT